MGDLVNVVIPPLGQPFTYRVEQDVAAPITVGWRVQVPFGNRRAFGFVIAETTEEARPREVTVKSILGEFAQECFTAQDLEFYRWAAQYYGAPLANILEVAIPQAPPPKFDRTVHLLSGAINPRGSLQREILAVLKEQPGGMSYAVLSRRFRGLSAALRSLSAQGAVRIDSVEIRDQHLSEEAPPQWAKQSVDLDDTQRAAVARVVAAATERRFEATLLYGVTGSGKTEVYIEAIRSVLAQGLGALVLVPEIALTPQLIDRFRARLGNQIAVLHSALSPRVRWDSWRALLRRTNRIAIGARSSIFAPIHDLGLIIVDEEHDGSYKQSEGLRYNARDLAVARAKFASCPIIMGSATPSLESFYNVVSKRYQLVTLPRRHESGNRLELEIIDLNRIRPRDMPSKNITPQLLTALQTVTAQQEQAFVLYNRRGFATYLQCERCEAVLKCDNCSVTLTYHRNRHLLLCHYCNAQRVVPQHCPHCASTTTAGEPQRAGTLSQRGAGTEKVFEELTELFPDVRIERLDRDVVEDAAHYRQILDRMRSGETSILVGTQMIAKGHDLPGVTLVGVVDCDVGLHLPDFRAGERTFQLLTQAAGRAGRGDKPGRVILQTRVPNHPSLQMTLTKDYLGFAKRELAVRREMIYPPYTRLLRIVASSQAATENVALLMHFRAALEQLVADRSFAENSIRILGPAAAPLERLKTHWRHHLLVKCASAAKLNTVMCILRTIPLQSKRVKVIFDIDPQEML